jgi:hypothetical protein
MNINIIQNGYKNMGIKSVLIFYILLCSLPGSSYAEYAPVSAEKNRIVENTKTYKINVFFPEIKKAGIDDTIKKFVQDTINSFKSLPSEQTISHQWENTLYIDYQIYRSGSRNVSFKFEVYIFTGGAHGITSIKTFTFDMPTQKEIYLTDLFKKDCKPFEVIYPLVKKRLEEKLNGTFWIEQGTGKEKENYKHFVLSDRAVIFFFQQYQVAPYAMGIQEVKIPLTELKNITGQYLSPDKEKPEN